MSQSLLTLLRNIVQANEKVDFRVFLSAFSSFHWSLLENAERKRGKSLPKSRLPCSSFIPKNRRRLCLLTPFYLVLSEDYIFRDFRGFRVFYLAGLKQILDLHLVGLSRIFDLLELMMTRAGPSWFSKLSNTLFLAKLSELLNLLHQN